MIEKCNPSHPDKIADRIAGAIVDLAYKLQDNPKIAVEVLVGHGLCTIITESSVHIELCEIKSIVYRLVGNIELKYIQAPQDNILAGNQAEKIRCGDNGIFKGVPLTHEQIELSKIARILYKQHPYDGKYILDKSKLTICQSNTSTDEQLRPFFPDAVVNPLGDWTGGINVDTGCTNRKLGSDMADSVTGGGLHGKDLSKADVSVNIYAFIKAQITGEIVELSCSIGDEYIDGIPYADIVEQAREFINKLGGFEKFAEWGLF